MNPHFPARTQRYKAVFVVDLTCELRALDNLIMGCGVRDDETHAELLILAIRQVMDRWGFAYYTKPIPLIDAPLWVIRRVNHYVAHSDNFHLQRLGMILRWAPSVEIDEIWVEQGSLYFCYLTED